MSEQNNNTRPVVVFTEKRGVFFGYTDSKDITGTITLDKSRNCYYWAAPKNAAAKGFLGLAEHGPSEGSKISGGNTKPIILSGITCLAECTPAAAKAWEESTWK